MTAGPRRRRGGAGLARRSVAVQVRVLAGSLLVVLPLLFGLVFAQLVHQNQAASVLTLSLGPAVESNNTALLDMTEAESGWSQEVNGAVPVIRYRLKKDLVTADLDHVGSAIASDSLDDSRRGRYAPLLEAQRAAVQAWFDAAEKAEASLGQSLSVTSSTQADAIRAFRQVRDSNRALAAELKAERDRVRRDVRSSSGTATALLAVAVVLTTVLLALWGLLLRRSVSRPLERLRAVVARHRDGDRDAAADDATGAAEVRGLAADFNGLTRANLVLQEQQASVLLLHQLALDVAREVHGAPDIDSAVYAVCAMLGEGLAADRVLLYTHDEAGHIDQRTQWRRYDLPDLPPLPPSLGQEVAQVNEELRRAGSFFAVPDFLEPVVQEQDRAKRFYRATGARSLLMVPLGVGQQGLGVLSVMMVDGPRRWRRHEIQAAQQCAGYVAQSIVSLRLRELQDDQLTRLTELDRQKTDFLATVSHELRTPLTSIAGYLEMLEDGDYGDLTRSQLDALGTIRRNAVRLRGMIEDLLVLNRIEASGVQPSLQDVPVARLLGGVVEVLRPSAAAAGVDLRLAAVDPGLVVRVDQQHMERTFINLGSNAVKFTPSGGRVDLSAHADDDRVVVTVSDTGIGIPASEQANLFQRFFRASNATHQAIPGTGLGLAIARSIVAGHGGDLELESVEGTGTTIRVLLPLVGAVAAGNAARLDAV
ncbi:sensor histidine kinase [Pedococcus sp. NPDC057267]|uniref:sensor histidine kinase n=1 Tax=Pedococcus sp. NPDC057267 TaxID=3346077 RepID=UPI0036455A11